MKAALEVERSGQACYADMRARTDDPELQKLLDWLASEEARHVEVFTGMFQKVVREPGSMPEPSAADQSYLRVIMNSVVFDGPEAGIKRARSAREPVQMLRFAMQFERDAMLYWLKLFKLVGEKERLVLADLIRQEEQHMADIGAMQAKLDVTSSSSGK